MGRGWEGAGGLGALGGGGGGLVGWNLVVSVFGGRGHGGVFIRWGAGGVGDRGLSEIGPAFRII